MAKDETSDWVRWRPSSAAPFLNSQGKGLGEQILKRHAFLSADVIICLTSWVKWGEVDKKAISSLSECKRGSILYGYHSSWWVISRLSLCNVTLLVFPAIARKRIEQISPTDSQTTYIFSAWFWLGFATKDRTHALHIGQGKFRLDTANEVRSIMRPHAASWCLKRFETFVLHIYWTG